MSLVHDSNQDLEFGFYDSDILHLLDLRHESLNMSRLGLSWITSKSQEIKENVEPVKYHIHIFQILVRILGLRCFMKSQG